ncbi:Ig-like domain-containing protein [Chromobacterium vaccinii]|uniref:Ig-like domain-containing protein n=1 Tax=Chromobacterium vaccinii TaxID=1108595 RepID=UPI0011C07A51|nr:Ig-like domain-containing protein [Chromobacterium vaccinii]
MAIKKSAPARSASGVMETKNNIVAAQPAEKLTGKQEMQVKKKILVAEADSIAKTGTDVKGVAVDEQAVQVAQNETVSQADASSASSVVSNAGQADQTASVSHEAVAGKTGYSPWLLGTALVGGLAAAAGGGGGGGSKGGDGGGPVPQPAAQFKGTVIDGYIKGADVFLVDRNGKEIATGQKTDDRGNFSINNPDSLAVKIKGGVNVDTGAANALELYAPAGQSGKVMVTPLTTLVHKLVTGHGMSSADAKAQVQKALGLKGDADLLTQDPIEAKNLDAHKAAVKLATVIAGVGAGSATADKVLADLVASIKSNSRQDLNQALKALVERHAGSEKSATVDLQMKAIDAAADFQKIAESQKAIAGDAIPPEKAHIDVMALVGAEAAKSLLALKVSAASDAETVIVKFNGQVLVADSKGAYSIDASKLADGDYKVEVISADKAGNASISSQIITIDTTAPIVEIQMLGAQAGFSKGFTVNAGAVVTGVDLAKFDKTSEDGVDTYIAKAGAFKGDEVLKLGASLTDAAGNEGKAVGVELKIDSTAPAQPTIALKVDSGAVGDKITNDAALDISPAADGVSRVIKLDGVKMDGYDANKLAEGKHTVEVVDTDAAGNSVSSGAFTFELAKTAPTVELKAIAGEGGFSHGFTVNAGAVVTGVDLAKFDKTSKDGIDIYLAKAGAFKGDEALKLDASLTDGAGNEGKAGLALKIDTIAPVQPTIVLKVDSGVVGDKLTNDAMLDISPAEDGVSRVVKVDGVKVDGYDASRLADGKHTVEVIDADAAGNSVSSGEFAFELDRAAPAVELKAIAGEGGFSHGFTVNAGAVVTGVDLAKFDKSSKDGIDTYIAKAGAFKGDEVLKLDASLTDAAGNEGKAAGVELKIDTIAPAQPTIALKVDSGTVGDKITNDATLDISPAADGVSRMVKVDGVKVDGYYGGELAEGKHTVEVVDTDAAGNSVSSGEFSFELDKTAPVVELATIYREAGFCSGFTVTTGAVVAGVDLAKFDKSSKDGVDTYIAKVGSSRAMKR